MLATDLLIVGRGNTSFQTTTESLKSFILSDVEIEAPEGQFVEISGDTMTGDLILSTNLSDYALADDKIAVTKEYLSSEVDDLDGKITQLGVDLVEVINNTIDALKLDDLSDVEASGATDNQIIKYNADNNRWEASTLSLQGNINYVGTIDISAALPQEVGELNEAYEEETPEALANYGRLYVNTGTGSTNAAFSEVSQVLPTASGGEFIGIGLDGKYHYLGDMGGGLTFDSFSLIQEPAVEITTGSDGKENSGTMVYNEGTGQFTFTPVDLSTKMPLDFSVLQELPTV